MSRVRPLGILVNPMSGRDARRLFARAGSSTPESKRNQVERIITGAAASGVERVLLARDAFRITAGAIEALGLPIEASLLPDKPSTGEGDSVRAARAFRDAGCGAVVALGGDGTSRIVAGAWPDVPLLPLSTGTNNVFPVMVEATAAGAAAGLVAAGRVPLEVAAQRAKRVHVEIEGEAPDHALIDAAHVVGDHPGSLLPFKTGTLRTLVFSRAEPFSVGLSAIGGLLEPCSADESFGVVVRVAPPPHVHVHADGHRHVEATAAADGEKPRPLRVPVAPGLYDTAWIRSAGRVALADPDAGREGTRIEVVGPGLLAFDGDRARTLADGQRAWLSVRRDGPFVIDVEETLREAARRELYLDLEVWQDARGGGSSCC